MLEPRKALKAEDMPEITKDFLPLVVVMDSFLCWLALSRQMVQDVLVTQFSNAVVELSVSVAPKFGMPDSVSLLFSWTVRWSDHLGLVRKAEGMIAFELMLAMLQPQTIELARKLQTGELKAIPERPVTTEQIGQCFKPWPYPIDGGQMMLSSYVYNQAWKTMTHMEATNLAIQKPLAQA